MEIEVETKKSVDNLIYDFKSIYIQDEDKIFKMPSYSPPRCHSDLIETQTIQTKYFFIVNYYFEGKPSYCMYWKYKNNISDIFKDLSMKNETFKKHYDVVAFSFNCPNIINLKTNKTEKKDDDIIFKLNFDVSMILRKTKDKSNLIFKTITHIPEQKNIYENCINPDRAWILHLILNEPNIITKYKMTFNINYNNKVVKIDKDIFYMCLYKHYSKNI